MSTDTALILGIFLLLTLGGTIGWWLSSRFYESKYKELLDASIEVNRITIKSLEQTMREITERNDKEQNDQR
jgi:uncharacterized protein YneF (UPF0154 family)